MATASNHVVAPAGRRVTRNKGILMVRGHGDQSQPEAIVDEIVSACQRKATLGDELSEMLLQLAARNRLDLDWEVEKSIRFGWLTR